MPLHPKFLDLITSIPILKILQGITLLEYLFFAITISLTASSIGIPTTSLVVPPTLLINHTILIVNHLYFGTETPLIEELEILVHQGFLIEWDQMLIH